MGKEKKNRKHGCGCGCGCEHAHEHEHIHEHAYEPEWKNELRYIQEQLDHQIQMHQQFQEQIMEQFQVKQVQEHVHNESEVDFVPAREEIDTDIGEESHFPSKHTYINVWSRVNQVVAQNNSISFERNGPLAGGITRINNHTLLIEEAGDYLISLAISFIANGNVTETDSVALFINDIEIPFSQSRFASRATCVDDVNHVFQINGTGIYTIPKGTIFQVRNVGVNQIDVCSADGANSASLTLVKL
ncbi:hypothetical protein [Priestia taiwanensis]|uniref:Uncharacterized protein n=1 Tax=Priestia taiwanensis TaxID=1347902 RepID=A0A917AMW1_9BACI|nr:hypothetical protein [Priestia taiwanensis]MBM7362301.1 hypothetical protein [Priestia taiwanensis]GGE61070.1 hypothetical protein GCM10007140_09230 [Priestia taiwanensis]